jgi:hypothetical protein
MIVFLLAVSWLPYNSVRCVQDPSMSGAGHLATPTHAKHDCHSAGHASDAAPVHQHSGHHLPSCCQATSKLALVLASHVPVIDPPAVASFDSPAWSASLRTATAINLHRPAADLAHGPPKYLRFANLLV